MIMKLFTKKANDKGFTQVKMFWKCPKYVSLLFCWVWADFYFSNFQSCTKNQFSINPFIATMIFLYPLKTSENQRFSDVFRGYRKRQVAWNELISSSVNIKKCIENCGFVDILKNILNWNLHFWICSFLLSYVK